MTDHPYNTRKIGLKILPKTFPKPSQNLQNPSQNAPKSSFGRRSAGDRFLIPNWVHFFPLLVRPGPRLGGVLGRLGVLLWRLGASWARLGRVLGPSWAVLGASWTALGASWGYFGPSWGRFGGVLEPSWAVLGRLGGLLARLGDVLGASWGLLAAKTQQERGESEF